MPGPSCFFVPLRRFRSQLRGSALSLGLMQRWEAVFRRERKPVSFDRTFRTCSRLVAGTGCFVAGAPVFVLRCRRWLKRS